MFNTMNIDIILSSLYISYSLIFSFDEYKVVMFSNTAIQIQIITAIKIATITKEQVKAIAEQKMEDLNAASIEAAMSMVAGTARSMGVTVIE